MYKLHQLFHFVNVFIDNVHQKPYNFCSFYNNTNDKANDYCEGTIYLEGAYEKSKYSTISTGHGDSGGCL